MPQRPHGDDYRYPPRSSFLHHLPPPIPSASSPHSYSQGQTDPSSWASERDRPGSASRGRWSPVMPFDRPSSSSRLPSLADYPHRPPVAGWDAPSPSSYPGWNGRPSTSYHTSPSKPVTSITDARPSQPVPRRASFSAASSPHTLPSPGQKHSAPDENSQGTQRKKKRRVALSCAECAKRKQRCNRETPCQHCVARRVPELCVPYTRPPPRDKADSAKPGEVKTEGAPPARTPGMLPTLSVRVARIEALLNVVVNRVDGIEGKALSDWRINHAPATSPPPIHSTESVRSPSPSLSQPRTANDVERESMGNSGDEVEVIDQDTSLRNPLPQSMLRKSAEGAISLGLDTHGSPAEKVEKLLQECGVSPEKVYELVRELPNEEHANRLLDWFFAKFNYVRFPIDEHLFRKSFEELYASQPVTLASVLFLPVVFIVFCISSRVAPDDWGLSEEEKRAQSLQFYWNSKNAVIVAQALKSESVQLVETKLLTGLYLVLMHDRRLAEAWAEFRQAVTIGQAIGLHRDGTQLRLDRYSTENRRRLWSYLIHADATYSCLLGRPTMLDPRFSDTLPPSNLSMDDLLIDPNVKAKPDDEPTFATYLILRRGLGEIVAKVTRHFQLLGEPTQYREVEAIDAEFKAFVANLPPAFRMHDPDRQWDDKIKFLPIHRYYIQTEILHFTIILHRPWLLRKLRSHRYDLSRAACIEAAVTDFNIRLAFKRDVPDFFETLLASSYREFNVAMIAGISIIIDPRNKHSKDMRAILQKFLEDHPHDPSMDDFSRKESAIIYTLHCRAKEFEERRMSESVSRSGSSFRRGTQDNISAERTEPVSQPPRHSSVGSLQAPSSSKSPVQDFIHRQRAQSVSNGSPDDDQPQQLLDHWLMSNTSFGPPLSSLSGFQGAYPPAEITGAPMGPLDGNPGMQWMDPNQAMAIQGLGMTLAPGPQVGVNMNGGFGQQPVPNAMQDGTWGDGNSAQYWNNLVDRISGIVSMGPSSSSFEMGVPSASV